MSGKLRPTTFCKWSTPTGAKREQIDNSGSKIVEILKSTDCSEGNKAWHILADLPEVAFITMNSVFLKDFTIIHHAKVMGHQLFKEDRNILHFPA